MKISKGFAILVMVLSMALMTMACQGESQRQGGSAGEGASDAGAPGEGAPTSNESDAITMVVWQYNVTYLKNAARLYEQKTGIKVDVQNDWAEPEDWGKYEPFTTPYVAKTLADLTVGKGADIYDVTFLEFEQLGKNGRLTDMSGWLETNPGTADDTVFRKLLLSRKTEDGIFAMQLDFSYARLSATSAADPRLEDKHMTWREFFEKVEGLDYTNDIAFNNSDLNIFMERFLSRASYFIDVTGNTQGLYSAEMISLLEECRDWSDRDLCINEPEWWSSSLMEQGYNPFLYTGGARYAAETFCTLPESYRPELYCFAPYPSDSDPVFIDGFDRYPYASWFLPLYGVNAGSPNAEKAQDFLLFLLSEEAQEKMLENDGVMPSGLDNPINRAVFRSMIETDLERVLKTDTYLELDFPALMDEAEGRVDEIAYTIGFKPCYYMIREAALEFFNDEISADEAAKRMADRVSLYLKEQS